MSKFVKKLAKEIENFWYLNFWYLHGLDLLYQLVGSVILLPLLPLFFCRLPKPAGHTVRTILSVDSALMHTMPSFTLRRHQRGRPDHFAPAAGENG